MDQRLGVTSPSPSLNSSKKPERGLYAYVCVCIGTAQLAKLLDLKRVFMYFVTQENEMCKSKCQQRRGDF